LGGADASDDDTLWSISADVAHKGEISKQTFATKTATLRTHLRTLTG